MNFTDFWAKSDPYHPLWRHLLDAAAVCEQLLPRFGGVPPIPDRWVMLLVAMHDVGKADPEFQNKAPELADELRALGLPLSYDVSGFRHEARSADWMIDRLMFTDAWGPQAAHVAEQAIRGHHGMFETSCESEEDLVSQAALWNPLREDLARVVQDALQLEPWSIDRFEDASAVGLKLSGLIILSDWIASNDELFHYPDIPRDISPADYFSLAQAEAKAAIHRLGLQPDPAPTSEAPPIRFSDLWPECKPLRPSQRALDDLLSSQNVPPGLAIIEAPMGEGKTEAAIYLAERWRIASGASGAYLALPTMATSNQMHGRYEEFLKRHRPGRAPRLVHGMAWLIDEVSPTKAGQIYGEQDATEWFRSSRRALIA
ncbi:MAG TPA: CRISPR-associated endonuclease Cas3'', partial [Armatimonadota bacterium]|nr:CRISPR-associated endonuclease Cas3'' [Armatimonadota bacterium]